MKKTIIGGLAALAIGLVGTPVASADEVSNCRVDVMNNGRDAYTYCTVTDESGYSTRMVQVCYGGSNHCTVRRAG